LKQYLKEISYLLGSDKRKLSGMIALFLIVSLLDLIGLGLIAPYTALVVNPNIVLDSNLLTWTIYFNISQNSDQLLKFFSMVLILIFTLKVVTSIIVNYVITRFSYLQQLRLRGILMKSYVSMPYSEYQQRNSSEYVYGIQNLTSQFSQGVLLSGLHTVSNTIISLFIFAMLAWTDVYALTVLILLLAFVVFSYDRFFRHRLYRYGVELNQASVEMVQGINEGMEGFKEIRILGISNYFYNKVYDSAKKNSNYLLKQKMITTSQRYLIELTLVSFVVILVMSNIYTGGDTTSLLPVLSVFGIAAMRLMPIANNYSSTISQLRYSRDSVSRLYKDILKINNSSGCSLLGLKEIKHHNSNTLFHKIVFEDVGYSYPNTKTPVLKSINLTISKGESIGIIGESGSGKTTLIDMITGLIRADSGKVHIDNIPIDDLLTTWNSKIAYLPQEIFLIDNTLEKNIALGVEDCDIDHKLVKSSLEKAQLTGLVGQLKDGVKTMLGERGIRLSGGQRQRVALARALYHRREILIMDESTSALDSETEKEIVSEVRRLKGEMTIIIIAHRYSTVEFCDRILKLGKGLIISSGSSSEMLK
jgi:ATP-binding cassette, subfamily B, bacterial PglK